MNIFFLNIIIFLLKTKFSYNYIVLPFNSENNNNIQINITLEEEIKYFLQQDKLYTLLSYGDSVVELYFSIKMYYFVLGKGLCRKNTFSDYSIMKSKTFKNISFCDNNVDSITNAFYSTDKISLFNNIQLDKNVTLNNYKFLLGVNRYIKEIYDINKICGYIGLQIEYNANDISYNDYNFIKILKKERIIPAYTWGFLFFENNDKNLNYKLTNNNTGIFIAGIEGKDYKEIFSTEDIRTTKAKPRYGALDWGIIFNEVYFENKITSEKSNYQNNLHAIFYCETNFIMGTSYFFENVKKTLFKEYLKQNICFINEKDEPKIQIIICENKFSEYISKFPDLKFYHKELNYTFILKSEELFAKYGNHIYFLIIYKEYYGDYWHLGTIFMKKYPFLFDYDKKIISFINIYNNTNNIKGNNAENFKNKFKRFINIIKNLSIIIGILIGILIAKNIWDKNRKKRTNELFDNYQYESFENNNKCESNKKLYEMK